MNAPLHEVGAKNSLSPQSDQKAEGPENDAQPERDAAAHQRALLSRGRNSAPEVW